MVSHENYHLIAHIENYFIFQTSKLVTCFIDGFALGMNHNRLLIYLVEVNIYIDFLALNVRCTQFEFCE